MEFLKLQQFASFFLKKVANDSVLAEKKLFEKYPFLAKKALKLLSLISILTKRKINVQDIEPWLEINKNRDKFFDFLQKVREITDIYPTFVQLKTSIYQMILSTKPTIPGVEISSESLIKGIGSIPDLFLYIGKPVADKDSAFEYFILESFKHLLSGIYVYQNPEEVSDFISKNFDKIKNLKKLFQYNPKFLGAGADGVAWQINDKMVLKLFTSDFGFDQSLAAMKYLHAMPEIGRTESMLYDAGILGHFKGKKNKNFDRKIYYYIIEKLDPVENQDHDSILIIDLKLILKLIVEEIAGTMDTNPSYDPVYQSKWVEIKNNLEKYIEKKELLSLINEFVTITKEKILKTTGEAEKSIRNKLNLRSNWLDRFIEEVFIKYLTGRGDLHLGNLGITPQGELRYFDPSHKNWQSIINY